MAENKMKKLRVKEIEEQNAAMTVVSCLLQTASARLWYTPARRSDENKRGSQSLATLKEHYRVKLRCRVARVGVS